MRNRQVWLVGLVVSYADARLPPKFLKATNGVGKIYAGRFGYSLVPAAPKFLVQASVDRKVVHVPVLRPVRKKPRPYGRRPPGPPEYGFNDYPAAASKTHPRLRKPPRYRKPRPPPREPEYYEQELEDEPEDFNDYDYEDKRQEKKRYEGRPLKRGYSSNVKTPYEETRPKPFTDSRFKRPYDEEEEFIAQHSELYASGYSGGKPKSRPTRTRDDDEPLRKYKPFSKGSKGTSPTRPAHKLYSASLPPSKRPVNRDENRYRYEEEEEEEVIQRPRYKKRPKYSEEDYDELPEEKEDQNKDASYQPSGPSEDSDFNPDHFYHDRKYEPKQKAKRGTEDKEISAAMPRPRRPSESDRNVKPFASSDERRPGDDRPSDERKRPEKKEPPPRRNRDKTRAKQEETREEAKPSKKSKWSIPFRLEDEEEEWDHRGAGTSEKPPKHEEVQNLVTIRPEEKPVNEHITAQSSWPVIVQGLNWKDPHPAFVENHPAGFMSDWQDFKIPQWPNVEEQLGQSLRSTFKWVEPTNQTPLHSTVTPPNHRTTTQSPIVVPPVDYPSRGAGSSNNEPKKKKSSKRGQKDRNRDGDSDIVAQRVVGGILQLNGAFKPDQASSEAWVNPSFRSATKMSGRSPQQQYTVEMFKSVEPAKPFDGEIVYGTRINDNKSKISSVEPDIGYHSGMETVDDDIGGWQVY